MHQNNFFERVNVCAPDECWNWTGPIDSRGYGHTSIEGQNQRAHRVAYRIQFGEIPRGTGYHGIVVMHICDNKLCCNPAHLKLGTHADNMADMKAKGRRKNIGAGAANGRAKLTPEQAAAIRSDRRSLRTIGREYGISPGQARRIRIGEQWASV